MLRTVHLHGRLGEKFGHTFKLDVGSPAEAAGALIYQLPGFEEYIRHRNYAVIAGRSPSFKEGAALNEHQLAIRLGRQTDIHIVPAPLMAGIETAIIIGLTVALVAIAAVSLVMMRTPAPGEREEATKVTSAVFDGAENSIEQGHAVPLIIGEVRCGSVVVSSGISTADGTTVPTPVGGNSGFITGVFDDQGSAGAGVVGVLPGVVQTTTPKEPYTIDVGDILLVKGGGKGGASAGGGAAEAPNSLQSSATARVVEAIGEGEIVGLVDGLKSIFLDGTPLQNADNSFNFQGISVQQRVGLPDQDYMPGFPQVENTTGVNTDVTILFGPVTQTINDSDVSVARVTIHVPSLYKQDTTNGDIGPTSVQVRISVQADGGGFTDVHTMEINGKTNSGYDRSVEVALPSGNVRNIRVTRLTADSAVASLVNKTRWSLLTEIVEAKLSYPNTALIGLSIDARQFGSNVPPRSYHVRGLIVDVPTNYNPVTRVYTGIWDGTFKRAWTNCPPWILRELLLNRRWGLGARIRPEAVDKWALYSIAQYCDELVPNFFGGTEPRYTINTVIKNKMQAYDLIAAIASNFRGWVYWGSGTIVTACDRPEDPSVLVSRSNVVDGLISYGRVTPHERRRSAAVVYWNDPADEYRLAPEIVEDADLIRRLGRRTGEDVTAFGVTSRGHAHRLGRFIMEDESPASNTTASYAVGDDHAFVAPGRIAMVADPMFTQNRRAGRVRSAAANELTIDDDYTIVAGQVYTVRTMLPDGSVSVRAVTNGAGKTSVLTLGGAAWPAPPKPGAVWTIETNLVANRQFRVRQIETDSPPYRVKAVAHDPTKYARVEQNRDIETPDFLSIPTGPLGVPTALGVFEFLSADGTASVPSALLGWTPPNDARVVAFQAQALPAGSGDWLDLGTTLEPSRIVRGAAPGNWEFRVRSVDSLGRLSAWQNGTAVLDGQTDSIPEVVAPGITIDSDLLSATLIWDAPIDMRPLRYEVMYSAGGAYGTAVSLGITDQLSFPITIQGNYWVRPTFLGYTSPAPVLINASALIFSAGIVPHLTKESAQLPSGPDGEVADYATAIGTYKIMSGTNDVSASFSLSVPAGGNPQGLAYAFVGMAYSVTGGLDAAEETGVLRIRATGAGDFAGVVLDKDFTVTKAKQGQTGNYTDLKFTRSSGQPATPIGADPAGWSDSPPAGTASLWVSRAIKTSGGVLVTPWSVPQSLSGLVSRGPYSAAATYYSLESVSFNGGSYVAIQNGFINQPPSGTGQANAYWDVLAAPGDPGAPAVPPSAFSATINLTSGSTTNLRSLADAAGYTGMSDATVTFVVPAGVTITGFGGSGKGLDSGTWPDGYAIALTITVDGTVHGGGGQGGEGGNGAGGPGGDAIYLRHAFSGGVTISASGVVKGGGGGGGGGKNKTQLISGEYFIYGGGGGGGGFPNGAGGLSDPDAYDAPGDNGSPGTLAGGGAGGNGGSTAGNGGLGGAAAANGVAGTASSGTGTGGPAGLGGYAIRKNGYAAAHTNNGVMTGTAG